MAINFGYAQQQGPDAFEILKSFGLGRDMARQDGARTSLASLVAQPNDRNALLQYAQYDPQGAWGIQQDQTKQNQGRQEEVSKFAAQLASQVQTPEEWDQAVSYYASNGYPEAERYRGQFGNRAAIMAAGGVQQRPEPESAFQRDYEFILKTQGPVAAQQFMDNKLNPQQWMQVQNPDGSITAMPVPRNPGAQSPQPTQSPQGNLPPGYTVRPKGGATPSASGNFR